jgi:hypothetical protein
MFPDAKKIILVMDNLNTHKAASLYKAFPPSEARRIIKRLEIHYTPKHGSWLDMAEIELNVMTRQCLSRRISTLDKLKCELSAWEMERNRDTAKIQWHFQTGDAREGKTDITVSDTIICYFLIKVADILNINDTVH